MKNAWLYTARHFQYYILILILSSHLPQKRYVRKNCLVNPAMFEINNPIFLAGLLHYFTDCRIMYMRNFLETNDVQSGNSNHPLTSFTTLFLVAKLEVVFNW
ncbi:MAG: hypothetical protein WDO19_32515 [Bacteroidota bacterium]